MFQQYHKIKFREDNEMEYVSAWKKWNISLFLVVTIKDNITVYYSYTGEERGESRFTLSKDIFLTGVDDFMNQLEENVFFEKSIYGVIENFIYFIEDRVLV